MLTQFHVKNLKSIDDITINCSYFNLFVGPNSSGKSTLLQSLLLISQNIDNPSFGINGPLVSLGEFREVINFNIKNESIEIDAKVNDEIIGVSFSENMDYKLTNNISSSALAFSSDKDNFRYLSSQRIGYRDVYDKNLNNYNDIGVDGEFAINYLQKNASLVLEDNLVAYSEDHTLLAQVNYWLYKILKTEINVENISGTDLIKARYEVSKTRFVRPKNVGAGTSYLISIIISCLSSKSNSIIVIESPEIHLHPTAQSKLCEFFYFISKSKRQLFVETHSDHIFNGIRAGLATSKFCKENIIINYVSLDNNNCTNLEEVEIGPFGKINNNYPELFNQFDIDLNRMLGLYERTYNK